MKARTQLHLIAFAVPFAAALPWCLLMFAMGSFAVDGGQSLWGRLAVFRSQLALFSGLGALAAQAVALLSWPLLDRRAQKGGSAATVGVFMAGLTHALFGVLFVAIIMIGISLEGGDNSASFGDLVAMTVFFAVVSAIALGWLSFPLCVWFAHRIVAGRRRELLADKGS